MNPPETGWFYLGLENGWTLCIFNVKFGEIIYSGDPINILPPLCKYESFQMMISLAELQIYCCCLFLDLKVCLEESRLWVTMKTLIFFFFPKKEKAIFFCADVGHFTAFLTLWVFTFLLEVRGCRWADATLLSPLLFKRRKWQPNPAQGIAICRH